MLEWLRELSEAQRALLLGLVVERLVQVLKLVADRCGIQVTEAKLSKLITAVLAAGVATYVVTGNTPAFWGQWLAAAATAVLIHEAGGKAIRKAKSAVDNAVALIPDWTILPLLLCVLLACTWCAGPAIAADIPAPQATVIGALDGGPTLGAAASWEVAEVWELEVWLDLGIKREDAATRWFAGGSTPAVPLLEKLPVLKLLAPALDRTFPARTRLGTGMLTNGEPLVYLAYSTQF